MPELTAVGLGPAVRRRTGAVGRARLGAVLCCGLLGLAAAQAAHALDPRAASPEALSRNGVFASGTTLLLGVGLYAGMCGISAADLRRNRNAVLAAVTVGVVAKALLIGAVVYLFYRSPASWLLGIAVAQIDPLAVAATLRHRAVSPGAKAVLTAWACFDDPATILLTAYVALPALTGSGLGGPAAEASAGSTMLNLALNASMAGAVYGCVRLLRPGRTLMLLALPVLVVLAAAFGLLLGLAVLGLFFRPLSGRALDLLVTCAVLAAAFLLGAMLRDGVDLVEGLLLGAAAYAAQIAVGLAITRRRPRRDRAVIALGQQNGLTALALALALEPSVPQAVRVIGVAVGTTWVLYGVGNLLAERFAGGATRDLASASAAAISRPNAAVRARAYGAPVPVEQGFCDSSGAYRAVSRL